MLNAQWNVPGHRDVCSHPPPEWRGIAFLAIGH